jgi:hypothetical protein
LASSGHNTIDIVLQIPGFKGILQGSNGDGAMVCHGLKGDRALTVEVGRVTSLKTYINKLFVVGL